LKVCSKHTWWTMLPKWNWG